MFRRQGRRAIGCSLGLPLEVDPFTGGLPGFHPIRISECGARSHALWKRLARG